MSKPEWSSAGGGAVPYDQPPQGSQRSAEADYLDLDNEYGEVNEAPNNSNADRPSGKQVGGAAVVGGLAGLVLAGPVVAVAAAAGVGYAATTKGKAGEVTRATGSVVASVGDAAGDGAKKFDEDHQVVEKTKMAAGSVVEGAKGLDEKHQIVENTRRTFGSFAQSARNFDERHQIMENTKKTGGSMVQSARNFEQEHKVGENVSKSFVAAGSFIGSLLKPKSPPPNS